MDLVWYAGFLNKLLREVCEQSFYKWNYSKEVIYPFLTYEFQHEPIDDIRDEFTVTLSMFDEGTSYIRLLELENEMINHLNKKYLFLDNCNVYIRLVRTMEVPTGFDSVKRRELEFVMKVDWIKG